MEMEEQQKWGGIHHERHWLDEGELKITGRVHLSKPWTSGGELERSQLHER